MLGIAFGELGLHRVEAGTVPHNARSRAVLERTGFVRFGYAPAYLKIAGEWQDHVLYQVLNAADGSGAAVRSTAQIVDGFYALQRRFYAGEPVEEELAELLAPDVAWHVPGRNVIAGDYRGRAAVCRVEHLSERGPATRRRCWGARARVAEAGLRSRRPRARVVRDRPASTQCQGRLAEGDASISRTMARPGRCGSGSANSRGGGANAVVTRTEQHADDRAHHTDSCGRVVPFSCCAVLRRWLGAIRVVVPLRVALGTPRCQELPVGPGGSARNGGGVGGDDRAPAGARALYATASARGRAPPSAECGNAVARLISRPWAGPCASPASKVGTTCAPAATWATGRSNRCRVATTRRSRHDLVCAAARPPRPAPTATRVAVVTERSPDPPTAWIRPGRWAGAGEDDEQGATPRPGSPRRPRATYEGTAGPLVLACRCSLARTVININRSRC